jgi:acetyl esterase
MDKIARLGLDPDADAVARQLEDDLPRPLHKLGVAGIRDFVATELPAEPLTPVFDVREHLVPTHSPVRVRSYRPTAVEQLPALLYVHGGGWVAGSLDGVDELCRALAVRADCAVFSVEYRLAPESPYPSALDDVRAAYQWLLASADDLGVDPSRVAVAGDSAGGNLVAALCLDNQQAGRRQPVLQVLAYPAVDTTFERESWLQHRDAPLLTAEDVRWLWRQYVGDETAVTDPLAAPAKAPSLAGLPPAHIITAGVDPLRDDAEAYASRLREAGVAVTSTRYPGVFHGFFTEVGSYRATERAIDEAAERLRERFTRAADAPVAAPQPT